MKSSFFKALPKKTDISAAVTSGLYKHFIFIPSFVSTEKLTLTF